MPKRGLKRAILIALISSWASKTFLRKSGETISGRVLIALRPSAIEELSNDRIILLVSGTNGKTSTTRFLTKLVEQLGGVATSKSGSNLSYGVASSLLSPHRYAVLEVDELHLPGMIAKTSPRVVVMLNLTRDQLHRMHEVKKVADRWKKIADLAHETTFVIDIDDPFLNYATSKAKNVVRVSFGGRPHPDGAVCPQCGDYLNWIEGQYECQCGLTNKYSDRKYVAQSASERNAILANVAGYIVGTSWVDPDSRELERKVEKEFHNRKVSIRLTKNPASWTEALKSIEAQRVILVLNAREVDGIDTSWLFDVSFEILRNRKIVVTGERAMDMQYRLHVEGIESSRVANFEEAVVQFEAGSEIQALTAYTAFFELSK